jgi:transposase-like protein
MKRYSGEEKARLVGEWERSGKSKWAFAREAGVAYQTFSRWICASEADVGFVEASGNLAAEAKELRERAYCALVVEQGSIRVHLPAGHTAEDLAVVVRALR